MRIVCTTQNTPEWFDARCGKVTGSNVCLVMSRLKVNRGDRKKGDSSAERERYKRIVIAETLSGVPVRNYVSPWMDEGRDNEPIARTAYEQLFDCEVQQTGFILHPNIDRFGSSPDGILPGGCVEFKCPAQNTHIEYMTRQIIPPEYIDQMQSEMACAEAEWCDFVSYCPVMRPPFDLYRVRVPRDNKRIAEIEYAVVEFLDEVAKEITQMAEMLQGKAPKRTFDSQAEASLEILDADWEAVIERRVQRVEEGVA